MITADDTRERLGASAALGHLGAGSHVQYRTVQLAEC